MMVSSPGAPCRKHFFFFVKTTAVQSCRKRIPRASEYIIMLERVLNMNYAVFKLPSCPFNEKKAKRCQNYWSYHWYTQGVVGLKADGVRIHYYKNMTKI